MTHKGRARIKVPLLSSWEEVRGEMRPPEQRIKPGDLVLSRGEFGGGLVHTSGEKAGFRDAIDSMASTFTEGGMSSEAASSKAREIAQRCHVRADNGGRTK